MTTASIEASLYGLLNLLNDPKTFKDRLTELTKAREGHEKAQADAKTAAAQLDAKRKETDDFVTKRNGELAAAKARHDEAAAESARRIEVNNAQMAELQRQKAQMDGERARFEADKAAAIRTKNEVDQARRQNESDRAQILADRADLDRRRRKLQEAVA